MEISATMPTILEAIAAQVRRAPGAPAVVCDGEQLSYAQLNERANQLAWQLRSLGVGADTLVALCVPRSVDMIVGILGILKAGGAYVPLDPSYPPDRLSYMLLDARCPVLLTLGRCRSQLPGRTARVVLLDEDRAALARNPADDPAPGPGPGDLAYVIYTSGSSGKPKGVMVTHGNLVHSTAARAAYYRVAPEVYLLLSSFAFDSSVAGIFGTLCRGGALCIPAEEHYRETTYLARLIAEQNVTDLLCIPSLHQHMLAGDARLLRGLRLVMLGGEAVTANLIAAHREALPETALVNEYGPTEATVWCTAYDCGAWDGQGPVPIGKAIADTAIHILDARLQPAGPGEAGELCVGGPGVARGYLYRPDLTAEKFIPDPFCTQPGARLYRTGDLARRLPDGTIEFLGRIDHQVKVRGFRIELGEVEAALAQHPAVREAAAAARDNGSGEKQLVGYLVPRNGKVPPGADLRRFLRAMLPEHMVPTAFVSLERLPQTPNGKVDRAALPAPDLTRSELGPGYVAPRDAVERDLAEIWETVLGVKPVGVRDDVFDLGVYSLTAARLFRDIEKQFGTRLPLDLLFKAPTVEQMAEVLRSGAKPLRHSSLVPIQPRGTKPILFCVHGGAGTILLYHDLARHLGNDQPVYGLQMQGLYGGAPPHTRVEDMAEHYLREMRAVQPTGPYWLAGYCFGGLVVCEMAQQLRRSGEAVALLAMFNSPGPAYIRCEIAMGASDPDADAAPARPRPTADKANRWQKLSRDPGEGRLAHLRRMTGKVFRHAAWKVRQQLRRVARWSGRLRKRLYPTLKVSLPESMRDSFFIESNAGAELAYLPEAYPGPLVLFIAQGYYLFLGRVPNLGWDEVVTGGVETHFIPGQHENQRTMFREPHVAQLAERFKDVLTRAARQLRDAQLPARNAEQESERPRAVLKAGAPGR